MPTQPAGTNHPAAGTTPFAGASPETAAPEAGKPPGPASPVRRRPKQLARWLTAGAILLSASGAWLLSLTSPLQSLELKTYDLRFVLNGKQAPPSGVVLVLIDPRTEEAIPDPHIFWHPYYATLLRAAARGGARAIGLDVSFALSVEKWAPDLDRQLAAAFAEVSATTPVVLAFDSLQPPTQDLPLYMLAMAQGAMGFTNLTLDPDGFVRRQELVSRDERALESFAARLAAVSSNTSWSRMDPERRTLERGGRPIPLDPSGFLLIHYWGSAGTFAAVSMADVLRAAQAPEAAQLEKWFQGKVVLVGTLDPADQQSTPFYLVGGGQRLTSGVEIQASVLSTLLDDRFLRELPGPWSMALVLGAALLAAFCIGRMKFPFGLLALVGVVAAYLTLAVISLSWGTVLPVVPPLMAVVLAGFTSYGAQALTEGRQKRLLQDLFGRYVSAEVAQELLEYGEVPLGGTRQPVTVMFADLRNYTSYCQGKDPQQVVEELNEYFADMSAEIKQHGGMINKFIGDGIMALFGAPVPHPDDARRAVACGLKMVERNEQYNRRRAERGLAPLVIGIGLHTGEAVVGNIGAPEKREYTAIGDAVNIASRIESENKTFGTRLLISAATLRAAGGDFASEPAGSARMKGIVEPMMLYKVLGLKSEA